MPRKGHTEAQILQALWQAEGGEGEKVTAQLPTSVVEIVARTSIDGC